MYRNKVPVSHCPSRSKGQGVNESGKTRVIAKAKCSQSSDEERLTKVRLVTVFIPESGRSRLGHGEANPTVGGGRQPLVVLFPRVTHV